MGHTTAQGASNFVARRPRPAVFTFFYKTFVAAGAAGGQMTARMVWALLKNVP
jgi:hypothetical protein